MPHREPGKRNIVYILNSSCFTVLGDEIRVITEKEKTQLSVPIYLKKVSDRFIGIKAGL
jgi:hypothetical protein